MLMELSLRKEKIKLEKSAKKAQKIGMAQLLRLKYMQKGMCQAWSRQGTVIAGKIIWQYPMGISLSLLWISKGI